MSDTANRTPWAGIVMLGLGIFVMTTMEELPIGVLTLVADDLDTSHGTIGLGVTIPGILAGVVAIFVPKLVGRTDRRFILAGALAANGISGVLSALSPTAGFFLASRILVGVALGMFWALLGATVVRVAAEKDAPKALTVAFSGAAAAIVLGVPLATWLGERTSWEEAFIVVAGAALLVALGLILLVPAATTTTAVSLGDIAATARLRGVQFGVAYTLILVTAHFTAYTYASPLLQDLGGVPVTGISTQLFVFGIAGLAGNFLAGPMMKRSLDATVVIIPAGVVTALLAFALFVGSPLSAGLVMLAWGLFGGAISVVSQAWVLRAADDNAEAGSGLNSGAFNIGIASGAFLGGQAGEHPLPLFTGGTSGGSETILLVAGLGVAAACALAVAGAHVTRKRRRPRVRQVG
ncbi:MFS transporter [Corynebacterium antarcticum]|uniref:MFS transporter n=1 Tax=Corynebacterium antarcticum TaxID=2800405 RepID=UPI002006C970|nr:MFS transporter [Corynebacterium antarcticum]MCK7642325.1 MFS transporter [Corynebacterium antarcticum]MCK7660990.1 MFS transporter [Corynebacterium antarcticum]